jgi:CubicO group peptidase (beta-lactamase class C family)
MAPIVGYRSLGVVLFIALTLPFFFIPVAAWGQSDDVVPAAVGETGRTDVRAQEIDSMLSKYFAPGEPGATVIVSQRGAILFRKAYGLANIEMNMPLRPEMSLRTGSVTKQFTAAAIMLLIEQGRLSVSDEIGKYFPQYPEQARHVTIEHLLTHTSGIRNYTELAHFGAAMTKDVSVDEAIAFFSEVPMQFQPGQRFSYSNSNYFLLGAIIEKVSGMRYSDFMQQQIFQPLQMRSTVVETSTSPVSSVVGYTQGRKGVARVNHYSMNWPFSAGALRTSVDDLVRWDSAITTGKLLGRVSWDSMAKDRPLNGGSHTGYGYGWFIRSLGGSHALEHGGDIGGFSADTWRFPKEELFVAVLTNNDSHEPAADSIAEKIAKILLRR